MDSVSTTMSLYLNMGSAKMWSSPASSRYWRSLRPSKRTEKPSDECTHPRHERLNRSFIPRPLSLAWAEAMSAAVRLRGVGRPSRRSRGPRDSSSTADVVVGSHGTWIARALHGLGCDVDADFWLNMPMPAVFVIESDGERLHASSHSLVG